MFSLSNSTRGDNYSDMQCPKCLAQMQLMQRYDGDIDYCPSCKGVWLDRGEIDKIAKIQSSHEGQHYNKYHYGKRDYDDYDDDDYIIIDGEREAFLVTCLTLIKTYARIHN